LSDFNLQIDNLTKTVTLYYPDRSCSGRLVSWSTPTVEIPFKLNNGTPQLRVEVHDEAVRATFDTGSTDTLMDLGLARRAFGLTPQSPGMRSHGEQVMISGKKVAFYGYTFKTLTVSGLTFENVNVTLGDFERAPLVLGMNEISQLDLYIAFKRKIIYATRREAK
jgi:predicted aspartyl protease